MVDIYVSLIKAGRKTLADVPEQIRQEVADKLAAETK